MRDVSVQAALLSAALCASVCCAACTQGDIGDAPAGDDTGAEAAPDAGAPLPEPDAAPPPPEPDAAPPPVPCDDGVRNVVDPVTGACYMFFDAEVPWQIALAACATLGPETHLATVTDAGEVQTLQGPGLDAVDVWLGATDAASEDTFVWITGEPLEFDNWRSGEPNDGGANTPDRDEDCMIQEVDNGGTWDDRSCSALYPYFCEREP